MSQAAVRARFTANAPAACTTSSGCTFDGSYTVNAGGACANTGVGMGAAKFTVAGQSLHGSFVGSFDPTAERAEDGMPE